MRRVLEVLALVLLTSTLWFCIAYLSPCRPLPAKVSSCRQPACQALETPRQGACGSKLTVKLDGLFVPAFSSPACEQVWSAAGVGYSLPGLHAGPPSKVGS